MMLRICYDSRDALLRFTMFLVLYSCSILSFMSPNMGAGVQTSNDILERFEMEHGSAMIGSLLIH